MQSQVEEKLISISKTPSFENIFSDEVVLKINEKLSRSKFKEIVDNNIPIRKYLDGHIQDPYGKHDYDRIINKISFKGCFLVPLFADVQGLTYKEATIQLADHFKISYSDEMKDTDEDFLDQKDFSFMTASGEIQKGKAFLFPNYYILLPVQPDSHLYIPYISPSILNLELIRSNANAVIFFTASPLLSSELQKKFALSFISQELKDQEEYWTDLSAEYTEMAQRSLSNRMGNWGTDLVFYRDNPTKIISLIKELRDPKKSKPFGCYDEIISNYFHKTDAVWSSFLGDANTIDWIDFKNRYLYFFSFDEEDKSALYEKFLASYSSLKKYFVETPDLINVKFIKCPKITNQIDYLCNNIQVFSPEEFLLEAYNSNCIIPQNLELDLEQFLKKRGMKKIKKFIIDTIMRYRSFNLLIGTRGSSKSFVGMGLAYSIATKTNITSRLKVTSRSKVLFLNGEVDNDFLDERKLIFEKMHSNSAYKENVICKTDQNLDIATLESQAKVESYILDASLNKGIKGIPVSVIVLDCLAYLSDKGHMETQWKLIKRWIDTLRQRNISVLLLHHSNERDLSFGTSYIEKGADSIVLLKKEIENDCLVITVQETKNKHKPEGKDFKIKLDTTKKPKWIDDDPQKNVNNWRDPVEKKIEKMNQLRNENTTWLRIADSYGMSLPTIEKFAQDNNLTDRKKNNMMTRTNNADQVEVSITKI